ncbi:hypothetical protein HGRIS_014091 [Hohenbuehelia grisea]|uniref:Uncharacterized protein n=1 Tax=Hohenbuehelia grisea TaxID=104357 RepID=A0ABR3JSI0_9AGAR
MSPMWSIKPIPGKSGGISTSLHKTFPIHKRADASDVPVLNVTVPDDGHAISPVPLSSSSSPTQQGIRSRTHQQTWLVHPSTFRLLLRLRSRLPLTVQRRHPRCLTAHPLISTRRSLFVRINQTPLVAYKHSLTSRELRFQDLCVPQMLDPRCIGDNGCFTGLDVSLPVGPG